MRHASTAPATVVSPRRHHFKDVNSSSGWCAAESCQLVNYSCQWPLHCSATWKIGNLWHPARMEWFSFSWGSSIFVSHSMLQWKTTMLLLSVVTLCQWTNELLGDDFGNGPLVRLKWSASCSTSKPRPRWRRCKLQCLFCKHFESSKHFWGVPRMNPEPDFRNV